MLLVFGLALILIALILAAFVGFSLPVLIIIGIGIAWLVLVGLMA
jgi:hypothetical protein